MVTVDMNRAQIWHPPILSERQKASAPQWNSTSIVTNSHSRPAQHDLHRDEAEGGQEYNNFNTTSYDDEKNDASDYFPTIEEILNSTWCKSIWLEEQHGSKDDRESLDKLILDQSTTPPDLIQSTSGCDTSSCEGTWDRPVVLDDDDTESTDTENETDSTYGDLHNPVNQQSCSPNFCSQSEDEHSSPFDVLQESKEPLQEKQQGWEKRNRRGDGYNEGDTEDLQSGEYNELTSELMVEESNEQQTLTHTITEAGDGVGDRLHEASDEDDEDPRPAKRRRTLLASHQSSPPAGQDTLQPCLERSSSKSSPVSTRDEAGTTHPHSLHTSRGGSLIVTEPIHGGSAEYHEWGLQHAYLKRTSIEGQSVFTLEFSLQDLHDLVALQASSHVPLKTCQIKTSARTAHSHRPTTQMKKNRPAQRQRVQRCPFTMDEDAKLIDLKEKQCLSWKDIRLHFPRRSLGGLQVHYCTKLKGRSLSDKDDGDSEG